MKLRYIFPVALALSAGPALADQSAHAAALPLSEIVAALENRYDIQFIDGIEWVDGGYWEIEFFTSDGANVALKIDPVTGEPRA